MQNEGQYIRREDRIYEYTFQYVGKEIWHWKYMQVLVIVPIFSVTWEAVIS